MEQKKSKECFIIMPISDPSGYTKGHFDKIYKDIFKPACELAGFSAIRADDVKQTNHIHIDIIHRLVSAPMAICDLSSHNPNVLFELGIRQAFDKPVVLVQECGTEPIFDINSLRYFEYRKEHKYNEVIEDQKAITKALLETEQSIVEGEDVNSIIQLLKIKPSVLGSLDNNIMTKLEEIKELCINRLIPEQSNTEYNEIVRALAKLEEMLKNGVHKTIMERNFQEISTNILKINDECMKELLGKEIDRIKQEMDKFLS